MLGRIQVFLFEGLRLSATSFTFRFPIMVSTLPPSGHRLLVSEKFVSLQGEGVSVGAPAAFLRLGNCNLSCSFCDTPYTWDSSRYDLGSELHAEEIWDLSRWISEVAPGRLIVTGGEPLLQQKQLAQLIRRLDAVSEGRGTARLYIEVETNGTVPPHGFLLERVDQWNVSPKLGNSGEPRERRICLAALDAFRTCHRAYLKFVVRGAEDVGEVDELVRDTAWDTTRVILMPEARDVGALRARSAEVAGEAMKRSYRFSGRIHLELFGGRRGT